MMVLVISLFESKTASHNPQVYSFGIFFSVGIQPQSQLTSNVQLPYASHKADIFCDSYKIPRTLASCSRLPVPNSGSLAQ